MTSNRHLEKFKEALQTESFRLSRKGIFLGNFLFYLNLIQVFIKMFLPIGLLISAPGASLSAGVPGSLLGAALLWGLPLPRTPAGVCAPVAERNGPFVYKKQHSIRKEQK
jgi:hypothetical protein